jgi:hypothetical protein
MKKFLVVFVVIVLVTGGTLLSSNAVDTIEDETIRYSIYWIKGDTEKEAQQNYEDKIGVIRIGEVVDYSREDGYVVKDFTQKTSFDYLKAKKTLLKNETVKVFFGKENFIEISKAAGANISYEDFQSGKFEIIPGVKSKGIYKIFVEIIPKEKLKQEKALLTDHVLTDWSVPIKVFDKTLICE